MKQEFKFHNPGKAKIIVRTNDQNPYADTSTDTWHWEDGGRSRVINWKKFSFDTQLTELLKAFVFSRLEMMAPQTVSSQDKTMLKSLNNSKLINLPWYESDIVKFLKAYPNNGGYHSFLHFYSWSEARSIPGFSTEVLLKIKGIRAFKGSSYDKIFLQQNSLAAEDEMKILKYLDESYDDTDFESVRKNVILSIGFELAPRSIQIHSLDITDIEVYSSEKSKEQYFTIWLPMAKKIRASLPERRPRNISTKLGNKILRLIELNKSLGSNSSALFVDLETRKRLPAFEIVKLVTAQLKELGFKKGEGLTVLRHHLGQSLADQGASAETIAEVLGHNSTVAARAYVAATPELSSIKSRALGKNETYLNIMKMFLTGNIIPKSDAPRERWVKGMVGNQYIGGIGACGLHSGTPCPKNPVYSCYTCNKFHPFKDGRHHEVKAALQDQAQFFVDTASSVIDLESNRAVSQLETTIHAVDTIIERCK